MPNGALPDGETVLMTAARTGEVVDPQAAAGLRRGPECQGSGTGQTALMWAATENHAAAAQTADRGGRRRRHAGSVDAEVAAIQVGRRRHGLDRPATRRLDDVDVRGARGRERNPLARSARPAPT